VLADQLTTVVDQLLIPDDASRRLLVLQVAPEEPIRTTLHEHLALVHGDALPLIVNLKTKRGSGYQLLSKALLRALGLHGKDQAAPRTAVMERVKATLAESYDLLIIDHAERLDYAGLYFLRPDQFKLPTILIARSTELVRTIRQHPNIARYCSPLPGR